MSGHNCERCDGAGVVQVSRSFTLGGARYHEDDEEECWECDGSGLAPDVLARALAAEWAWELYQMLIGTGPLDWELCPKAVRG